jgi:hypothetical protein
VKISELIVRLQALQHLEGDLRCLTYQHEPLLGIEVTHPQLNPRTVTGGYVDRIEIKPRERVLVL